MATVWDDRPLIHTGIRMTRRTSWFLAITCTLVGVSSCGGGPGPGSPQSSNIGTITRADLEGASYASAYHAVQSLRPNWLWNRGNATISDPAPLPLVYLDGVRSGDLEVLRLVSTDAVDTISRLSPSDATTRWGTGHLAGAIDVRTRRGRRLPRGG